MHADVWEGTWNDNTPKLHKAGIVSTNDFKAEDQILKKINYEDEVKSETL